MKLSIIAIVLGVLVCTATAEKFRIGAYNLQSFSTKKWEMGDEGDSDFMYIQSGLSEILSMMDLVLLQEIQDNFNDDRVTEKLVTYLKTMPDLKLSRAICETGGRYFKGQATTKGERYAYVYDNEKFEFVRAIEPEDLWTTLDLNENIEWDRPPFVVEFKFKGDEDLMNAVPSFWVIGIHVTYVREQRSANIAREIRNLLPVVDQLFSLFTATNFIILGDFNAGALSNKDATLVEQQYNEAFMLMTKDIGNTMSLKTGRAHDRIYFSKQLVHKLKQRYHLRAGIQRNGIEFEVEEEIDETQVLKYEETIDMCHLSDHLPVWVDLIAMKKDMEEDQDK